MDPTKTSEQVTPLPPKSEPTQPTPLPPKSEPTQPNKFSWFSQPEGDKPRVHGFENKVFSLKKLIVERESERHFKAIGVVGARGVGKTTLCQVCYYGDDLLAVSKKEQPKDEKIEATTVKEVQQRPKIFFPRVWIHLSEILDEIELTRRMLEKLGVREEKITSIIKSAQNGELSALRYVLRLQLTGKKYLVVLDDVQKESPAANLLTHALPKRSGGTVLVSVREEKTVKNILDGGSVLRVLPLSDRNSLKEIFKDAVNKITFYSSEKKFDMMVLKERIEKLTPKELFRKEIDVIEALEDKVVNKCNGLPLAVVVMARTMPDQLTRKENEKKKEKKAESNNQEKYENENKGAASSQTPLETEEKDRAGKKTGEQAPDRQVKGGESDTAPQKKEETSQNIQERQPEEAATSEEEEKEEEAQVEERHEEEAKDAQKEEDQKVDGTKAQAVPSTKGNDESANEEGTETILQKKEVKEEAIKNKEEPQVQEKAIQKKEDTQVQEEAIQKKEDAEGQEEAILKKDGAQVQEKPIQKKEDAQVQEEALQKKDCEQVQEQAIQKKEDAQVQEQAIKKKDDEQVQENAIQKKEDALVQEQAIKEKDDEQIQEKAIQNKEDAQVQEQAVQKKDGTQVQEHASPEKALIEENPDPNVKKPTNTSTEETVSRRDE